MIELECTNCSTKPMVDETKIRCPNCDLKSLAIPKSFQEELLDLKTHVEVLEHLYTEHTRHVESQLVALINQLTIVRKILDEYLELSVEESDGAQVH